MGFWSNLFGRKPTEPDAPEVQAAARAFADGQQIGIDDWLANYFNFAGNMYGYGSTTGVQGNRESVPHNYSGYSQHTFKSNGPIYAVSQKRMLVFSEVRFGVQRMENGRPADPEWHQALGVLENPWTNGTSGDLLARAIQDVDLAGNFFAVRQDRGGKPRVRRLRPDWVDIVLSGDPQTDPDIEVLGYVYYPGGDKDSLNAEVFPADGSNGQVAHWAPIPDPEASFRGMSWITPIVREVQADKSVTKHKQKFFENGATPSIAVSMKETVSPEKFAQFKRLMESNYAGVDNAYKTMYLGGGADVTPIGALIQQLDFRVITSIGEERICAAAGVHPTIVGLGPGLEGSSLNTGNFEAAKDIFVSSTLRPLWRTLCAALEVLIDLPENMRLTYDDRDIAFLREDREMVSRRLQLDATSLTRLVMNGWKPDESVEAIVDDDLRKLIGAHSGLYSVQLLPPNVSNPDQWGDANKNGVSDYQEEQDKKAEKEGGSEGGGAKKPAGKVGGSHNTSTGSKRKPTGRPKNEAKKAELIEEIVRLAGEDPNWLRAVLNGEPLEEET